MFKYVAQVHKSSPFYFIADAHAGLVTRHSTPQDWTRTNKSRSDGQSSPGHNTTQNTSSSFSSGMNTNGSSRRRGLHVLGPDDVAVRHQVADGRAAGLGAEDLERHVLRVPPGRVGVADEGHGDGAAAAGALHLHEVRPGRPRAVA